MHEAKKLSKILERLSDKKEFPVDPNQVAEMLCGLTPIECFRFIKVDMDDNVLKGGFVNTKRLTTLAGLYGDEINIACVFYSRNLTVSEERFCVIKELMHAIDPVDISTVNKPEHLISLIQHLSLSREILYGKFMKGITEETIRPLVDTMGDWRALLVMVPEKEREAVIESYKKNEITKEGIAAYFEIPKNYADAIIDNDFWDFIMTLWLGLDEFLDHTKAEAA
ncbi:hypothetical protein HK17_11720 [Acetobacter indonesiensis]|uniref:IrrE N-terminal-like domain-containing protein n=2 Tax=Acetobacter indonesiensis TaxID=104101 RepID=A0A252AP01_9PROT|nr:hypothetical protein HK17_11720 [Acetobacter indonesiensis]